MKTVVITGASGFIGENIAHRFRDEPVHLHLVSGTVRPRARARAYHLADLAVPGRFTEVMGDLEADTVIHTAAVTSPDVCERSPQMAKAVNVSATAEVARWTAERGGRMIYFSTDLVYDGENSPYSEEDPTGPTNLYGHTKLEGEMRVRETCEDWVVLRMALSYGPMRGAHGDWTQGMRSTLSMGRDLTLFTDQYRTPAYAGDTAEAVYRLAQGKGSGTYNMGGRQRVSRYDFALTFARIFNLPAERFLPITMEDLSLDAPRARDCSLVTDRISNVLDLELCDVEEGLQKQLREERHS